MSNYCSTDIIVLHNECYLLKNAPTRQAATDIIR